MAIHYNKPIVSLSRNNILENIYKHIHCDDLLVDNSDDYISFTLHLVHNKSFYQSTQNKLNVNKDKLFNFNKQYDIFCDIININSHISTMSNNYSEIEKLLFE